MWNEKSIICHLKNISNGSRIVRHSVLLSLFIFQFLLHLTDIHLFICVFVFSYSYSCSFMWSDHEKYFSFSTASMSLYTSTKRSEGDSCRRRKIFCAFLWHKIFFCLLHVSRFSYIFIFSRCHPVSFGHNAIKPSLICLYKQTWWHRTWQLVKKKKLFSCLQWVFCVLCVFSFWHLLEAICLLLAAISWAKVACLGCEE